MQIDLPPGMTATAIETKGASFTFADGKAKFIWMALPASPTFKISYTLGADASMSGVQHINGRLSYIEDNERKTHDMLHQRGRSGRARRSARCPNRSGAGGTRQQRPRERRWWCSCRYRCHGRDHQASGIASMQGEGGVSGTRTITPVTEKEMLIEVVVKKGDIRGFGKLQETIPQGFTALEKSSNEAIFTAQDRIVKFVWLNLPAANELKIVYKLRANEKPEGEYSIDGEFGYLLNDETQKAVLGTSKFFIGPKALEILAQMQQASEAAKQPVSSDPIAVVTPPVKETTPPVKEAPPVKEQPKAATTAQQGTRASTFPHPSA
ncbi:MAG: hypothetical protein IPG92_07850 [Flavobacteriales bacterium]|nr:hypothetical protein [Flavobacteriales bacterium]